MSESQNIDLFFKAPNELPNLSGTNGTLHLLRRDILLCLRIDPNSGQEIEFQALWPAAMAIFAGIDLLAKFYTGEDTASVGPRFKNFVEKYFDLDDKGEDRETIYQLRNALIHSFGLYSKKENKSGNVVKEWRFTVTAGDRPLITKYNENKFLVDLFALHKHFEAAVTQYRADVLTDMTALQKFRDMFQNYGAVGPRQVNNLLPSCL